MVLVLEPRKRDMGLSAVAILSGLNKALCSKANRFLRYDKNRKGTSFWSCNQEVREQSGGVVNWSVKKGVDRWDMEGQNRVTEGWGAEKLRDRLGWWEKILPLKIKRSSYFRWRLQSKCQKRQVMVEWQRSTVLWNFTLELQFYQRSPPPIHKISTFISIGLLGLACFHKHTLIWSSW